MLHQGLDMKRRNVLTSAGALAGIALTGCGGGGEDGAPSSQIAAYTIPQALVPDNLTQYQVEVVFYSKTTVDVWLHKPVDPDNPTNPTSIQIGWKGNTNGNSNKTYYGRLLCIPWPTFNNYDYTLAVTETASGVLQAPIVAGASANITPDTLREYAVHNNEETEYEWTFRSRVNGTVLAHVRFIPFPSSENITFTGGAFYNYVANTAPRTNGMQTTQHFPNLLPTTLRAINHETGVMLAPTSSSDRDTLRLPNHRILGHDELFPTYVSTAAGSQERLFVGKRLIRHMKRYANEIRNFGITGANAIEARSAISNEIARVVGGKKFIDYMNDLRTNFNAAMSSDTTAMQEIIDLIQGYLPGVDNVTMDGQVRQLEDDLYAQYSGNMSSGGGLNTTIAVQVAGSITRPNWPRAGITLGGGCRLSLPMFARRRRFGVATANGYTFADAAPEGLKFGVVAIVKLFDTKVFNILGTSMDVEVTISCTLKEQTLRIDNIAYDPVFDADTRALLAKLFTECMARATAATQGATDGPVTSAIEMTVPAATTEISAGGAAAVATAVSGATNTYLNCFSTTAAAFNDLGVRPETYNLRNYATAELSPLRVTVINSDTLDPATPLRSGFQGTSVGIWHPGAKAIVGAGWNPIKTGGTIDVSLFFRCVVIADLYYAAGQENVLEQLGLRMNS